MVNRYIIYPLLEHLQEIFFAVLGLKQLVLNFRVSTLVYFVYICGLIFVSVQELRQASLIHVIVKCLIVTWPFLNELKTNSISHRVCHIDYITK